MTELNFLGPETHENMFYRQINATTFFVAYLLTLGDIVETFRSQFTNIFKKNARGEEYFPPKRFLQMFLPSMITKFAIFSWWRQGSVLNRELYDDLWSGCQGCGSTRTRRAVGAVLITIAPRTRGCHLAQGLVTKTSIAAGPPRFRIYARGEVAL